MIDPVVALFRFTVRQTLFHRKIWMTVLLLVGPCVLTLLIGHFHPRSDCQMRYHGPMLFFLTTFVMPLVCMLHGTALIGSEVEGQTLVYLLTRRMRRATVLLVRFAATAAVLILLFELTTLAVFGCALWGVDLEALRAGGDTGPSPWGFWSNVAPHLYVVPMGIVTFLALFTLIGLLTTRPLTASISYFILVELVVGNVPVRAQIYTVSHHLRATLFQDMPRLLYSLHEWPREVLEKLYPADSTGIPALITVVVISLVLACLLVTVRELVPAKLARE